MLVSVAVLAFVQCERTSYDKQCIAVTYFVSSPAAVATNQPTNQVHQQQRSTGAVGSANCAINLSCKTSVQTMRVITRRITKATAIVTHLVMLATLHWSRVFV